MPPSPTVGLGIPRSSAENRAHSAPASPLLEMKWHLPSLKALRPRTVTRIPPYGFSYCNYGSSTGLNMCPTLTQPKFTNSCKTGAGWEDL